MSNAGLHPHELKLLLRSPDAPHAPLVVDVRRRGQFNRSHIAGSHHLPVARLLSSEQPDRDLILVTERTEEAIAIADSLHSSGFHRRIQHLSGGVKAWQEAGLALESNGKGGVGVQTTWSLREPWVLSLVLLGLAAGLQQGSSGLLLSAGVVWLLLPGLSQLLQRGGERLQRRCS